MIKSPDFSKVDIQCLNAFHNLYGLSLIFSNEPYVKAKEALKRAFEMSINP